MSKYMDQAVGLLKNTVGYILTRDDKGSRVAIPLQMDEMS